MKEKLKRKNEKKGISLIVLVITIIVIVILAVAVILSIANNNPIENANKAQTANNQKTLEEAANLEYATMYSDAKIKNEEINTVEMTDNIRENLKNQGFSEDDLKKVEITKNGLYIAKNYPVVPNGFVISDVEGENTISNGLVIYEGTEKVSTDTDAKTTRNQFVWVPVDNMEEFIRIKITDSRYFEPYKEDGYEDEVIEYNAMVASVEKYGGFYIARYEASENNGRAQSVANQEPWIDIIWGDSNTSPGTEGAVGKSRGVYSTKKATKEKDPVSTLCYGVQWDVIVKFLEKNYPGISSDSTNYGNYRDATFNYFNLTGTDIKKESGTVVKIPTGSTEYTKTNNIYDMCGNVFEWTMEGINGMGSFMRSYRGGDCIGFGNTVTVSGRYNMNPSNTTESNELGFRVALYIK